MPLLHYISEFNHESCCKDPKKSNLLTFILNTYGPFQSFPMEMLIRRKYTTEKASTILKRGARNPDIRHIFNKPDKINATELETSM
jgi:hypothetical protein